MLRPRSILPRVTALLLASCGADDGGPSPNVLLISIDTLRPDHLGCYGYGRETSPSIDRLARDGVLFENHISSSSWTLPAHAALFTSVSDSVHGCVEATGTALAPEFTTLAESFQGAGYTTAGFFAGPYLHPAFGLGQGFDRYENCASYAQTLDDRAVEDWAMASDVMRASHQGITNPEVYERGREWMQGRLDADAPFFAFLHFWDVHFDFVPPAPYDTLFDPDYTGTITGEDFFFDPRVNATLPDRDKEHLLALYDGEIRWTDDFIGKLLDDLADWGIEERTIVVLTSDHGTEFFEHGGKAHRTTLYDELIRIPLIVRYPDRLPAGRRVTEQTRIVDVGPTLLELASLPAAPFSMGESLAGLARGDELDFPNDAISELFSVGRTMRSVRTLESKFIDEMDRGASVWFDLENDVREQDPLIQANPEQAEVLRARYEEALEQLSTHRRRRPGSPRAPDLPESVSSQLDAFGYTGGDEEER